MGNSQWSMVNEDETISDGRRTTVRRLWKKIAVAASIVGLLFVAGYFIVNRESSVVSPGEVVKLATDVQAPDKNRAQIRLADGTTIYLDSVGNGQLANMNGVVVRKMEDGRIEYSRESSVVSGELEYNTVINPRGSKSIDMSLSDGSRVWLNAGSSITYPVAFIGNERKVSIDGEAYFEVAHHASKPFIVSKNDVSVTVLGTHFNVKAYDEEGEIRVTLLEGSVKVQSTDDRPQTMVLKPGEQALSMVNGELAINKNVDVEQVMAWKNGRFQFERSTVAAIMREVARWYNVEVIYENEAVKLSEFTGGIGRKENASEVLKMLEMTGSIHFKIEGRKVTVR